MAIFLARTSRTVPYHAAQPSWQPSAVNHRGPSSALRTVVPSRGSRARLRPARGPRCRGPSYGGAHLLRGFRHAGEYRRVLPPARVEKKVSPGSPSLPPARSRTLSPVRACHLAVRGPSRRSVGRSAIGRARISRLSARATVRAFTRRRAPRCGHCLRTRGRSDPVRARGRAAVRDRRRRRRGVPAVSRDRTFSRARRRGGGGRGGSRTAVFPGISS